MKFQEYKGKTYENKGHFKYDEDLKLNENYELFGSDWVRISSIFGDRSQIMIKNRYYYLKRNSNIEILTEHLARGKECKKRLGAQN